LTEDERAAAIALLEQAYQFPVDYALSVITVNDEGVVALVLAAVHHGLDEPLTGDAYQTIPSSGGRYISHRFRIRCHTPHHVLDLKDRVRKIEGVKSIL
jgi:putative lipoic acid-binding regulatory protein